MIELKQISDQELLQELSDRIECSKIQEKDSKIISLKISEEKLFVQLEDGRELSIPINWFTKWGVRDVTAEKLRRYEIWRGKNIFFSEIKEVLGIEKFLGGFNAPCQ